MIQVEDDLAMNDIISSMPVPIKSLQSVPFAASYIFGELGVSKPGAKKGKAKKISNEDNSEEDEDSDVIYAIHFRRRSWILFSQPI